MSEAVPCAWVQDRLELFLDGELGDREAAALRCHLMECPDCRKPLCPMVRSRRALREEVPVDAIPVGARTPVLVDRRFFTAMHRAIMARVRGLPMHRLPSRIWRVGASAAAASLFLVGLLSARLIEEPRANLLQRAPIQASRPSEDVLSPVVPVGSRSSWGLGGRLKALRSLPEIPSGPKTGSPAAPGRGKRP